MAGTNPVAKWLLSIFTTQDPATYKAAIDGNFAVAQRIVNNFAPYAQTSPNMTISLAAGSVYNGTNLTEVAVQTTGTITAPVSNSRIDRVVISSAAGTLSVITGTAGASPTAPAITAGNLPVARILLTSSSTNITNSMITDERNLASSSLVNDTSPSLGGTLNTNSHLVQFSKGADIASATALTLGTDGNYFNVTGTNAITSINTTGHVGTVVKLHFNGAVPLTYDATNLVLPGGANITTAAGDEFEFTEYGSGTFRCTGYTLASGKSVVVSGVIGQIIDFAGTALQTNFLATDGAAVSRTTYAALFAAIGTTWGVGNGTTTFNVPNLARYTTVGSGGSGTGTLGNAVGNTGGAETVTLTVSQLPTGITSNLLWGSGAPANTGTNTYPGASNSGVTATQQSPVTTATGAITSSNTSGSSHNNLQPSAIVYKQIRYQ